MHRAIDELSAEHLKGLTIFCGFHCTANPTHRVASVVMGIVTSQCLGTWKNGRLTPEVDPVHALRVFCDTVVKDMVGNPSAEHHRSMFFDILKSTESTCHWVGIHQCIDSSPIVDSPITSDIDQNPAVPLHVALIHMMSPSVHVLFAKLNEDGRTVCMKWASSDHCPGFVEKHGRGSYTNTIAYTSRGSVKQNYTTLPCKDAHYNSGTDVDLHFPSGHKLTTGQARNVYALDNVHSKTPESCYQVFEDRLGRSSVAAKYKDGDMHIEARLRLCVPASVAMLMEPVGSGKTATVLYLSNMWFQQRKIDMVVVALPVGVYRPLVAEWTSQVERFFPDCFSITDTEGLPTGVTGGKCPLIFAPSVPSLRTRSFPGRTHIIHDECHLSRVMQTMGLGCSDFHAARHTLVTASWNTRSAKSLFSFATGGIWEAQTQKVKSTMFARGVQDLAVWSEQSENVPRLVERHHMFQPGPGMAQARQLVISAAVALLAATSCHKAALHHVVTKVAQFEHGRLSASETVEALRCVQRALTPGASGAARPPSKRRKLDARYLVFTDRERAQRALDDCRTCPICLEEPSEARKILVYKCSHAICSGCDATAQLRACHICRQPVDRRLFTPVHIDSCRDPGLATSVFFDAGSGSSGRGSSVSGSNSSFSGSSSSSFSDSSSRLLPRWHTQRHSSDLLQCMQRVISSLDGPVMVVVPAHLVDATVNMLRGRSVPTSTCPLDFKQGMRVLVTRPGKTTGLSFSHCRSIILADESERVQDTGRLLRMGVSHVVTAHVLHMAGGIGTSGAHRDRIARALLNKERGTVPMKEVDESSDVAALHVANGGLLCRYGQHVREFRNPS